MEGAKIRSKNNFNVLEITLPNNNTYENYKDEHSLYFEINGNQLRE